VKKCCFIGHRKIKLNDKLICNLKERIEDLIVNHNVLIFLFGSRSEFDSLCHKIVMELKQKYPQIKRISYTCGSESFILESEKESMEKSFSKIYKQEVCFMGFEEECEFKGKYSAGKASYVERNQAMINDSDYCIFYYNENYQPPIRKFEEKHCLPVKPKSGTKIALDYAKKKKKIIYNFYDLNF